VTEPRLAVVQLDSAVPRLALTIPEAAIAVGMGRTSFEKYVLPELCVVRRGSIRAIPTRELERWLERNAERTLP
jgi:hypothetical protein